MYILVLPQFQLAYFVPPTTGTVPQTYDGEIWYAEADSLPGDDHGSSGVFSNATKVCASKKRSFF